jgi:hypothetical protein
MMVLEATERPGTAWFGAAALQMLLRAENFEVAEEEDEQREGGEKERAKNLRAIRLHGALA